MAERYTLAMKVNDLIDCVRDLVIRNKCSEQLIVGLIAELDKAQGRITALEDLAADYVQDFEDCPTPDEIITAYHANKAKAEETIRQVMGNVHIIADGVAHEVAGAFGLKL
ncbi:hypothetical protein CTP45_24620 [Salmonella enterica]|uniref:Uncharacterized protein n=1 Tax=Salmonella enterica subsp. enterica serovar Saintpaul TaxID=90105 RepID=A0A5U9I4Z2_SALET|nr:hypothetical protein [Salmonella enterica]EBS2301366.1 hypothetical protein [Salmonella enterica subsp. enterica serovar Saintpaul]EDW0017500.1 hypothetical protein [Salmonella enterica subsp. enterica serovar Aba]HCZ4727708.1 hypothetical protein [Salmonella enterica subsp. enterica serovar Saintpaul str. CFSAN004137]EAW8023123.1 hypothetical protein [Salmonella enterica]